jgi:hypothetical protein
MVRRKSGTENFGSVLPPWEWWDMVFGYKKIIRKHQEQ